jgi:AcrR family transcriptional regulator
MQVTSDRRVQIIEAMIEVIADEGVGSASFARIRERAGLSSTRLISYHFESKDELLGAALEHIVAQAAAVMSPRIAAAETAREKLAAYIHSNFEFLAGQPSYAVAAVEIVSVLSAPGAEGAPPGDAEQLLAHLFVAGQRAGDMRDFDVLVVASTVRAAIDRSVSRLARAPGADLESCGDELVELFDRAVRSD